MKRKKILILTLVITLALIVSTFGGTATDNISTLSTPESLEVVKEVYDPDGCGWVKTMDAEKGDTIQFRITVTYNNVTDPAHEHYAQNITVTDILPEYLNYTAGTADPFEPIAGSGANEYIWDFNGILFLYNGESQVITFNATVEECCFGEQINEASASAYEHCTGKTITGEDTATVNVVCFDSGIMLKKLVWDEENEIWAKETYAKEGDEVRFKIIVNNTGECDLYNLYLNDTLPDGLICRRCDSYSNFSSG